MRVLEVGVEEAFENRLGDLAVVHARVVPALDDEVDGVLDNNLRNLTRRLVQDQSEMVLRDVSLSPS